MYGRKSLFPKVYLIKKEECEVCKNSKGESNMAEKINDIISANTAMVNKKNIAMLKLSSFIAVLLQSTLLVASFFVDILEKNRNLYWIMLLGLSFVIVSAHTICVKYEKIIKLIFYIFFTFIFIFAIILGTVMTPNNSAVTFCVLFFVLPQLILDKVSRIQVFQTIIAVIFCIVTYIVKEESLARLDIVNVLSYLMISFPLNYGIIKNKVTDIENQRKILWISKSDGLTQIYNKEFSEKMIRESLNTIKTKGALMIVDIDRFKEINDEYGHKMGDEAIKVVAQNIINSLRICDIVGRFGGDEFIIFMVNVTNSSNAEKKANEIRNKITEVVKLNTDFTTMQLSVSVGISMYPTDGLTYDKLFEQADQALYVSKKKGRNQVTLYENCKDIENCI